MGPFYDLGSMFAAQFQAMEADSSRVFEAIVAIVTDNKDPQKLGRVKVKYPMFSQQDTSWWAPIVMLGAGKNRGWFFIPEVEDEVLVLFEQGHLDRPIVIGALWNGMDKPADKNSGGNPRRMIKSRKGSKITFDDDQGNITIEDGASKGKLVLDAKANKIVIQSLDGDVCIQAPQGELQIVCKTAELKAGQNLEIHSGATMKWGSGANITIKGSAGVTISGSRVNFNGGSASMADMPSANPKDVDDPYGS